MRMGADTPDPVDRLLWAALNGRDNGFRDLRTGIQRFSRQGLRISHLHRCYGIEAVDGCQPLLLFVVVQGHSNPCHWAHAYALVPGSEAPISRHFRFEIDELEAYRQLHADQSLRWMDTDFMFNLAIDQILREVAALAPAGLVDQSRIERVDNGRLLRYHINGKAPLLDALLAICGEHYLLHRQLQDIKAFPTLHID